MDTCKKIIILGAAESGVGAAILAKKQGFDVFVSDFGNIKNEYLKILIDNKIDFEQGKHEKAISIIENFNLQNTENNCPPKVVKSPGISDKSPVIRQIKKNGINVISEIEFAGRYTGAKMICITGSNGKTTTSMLVYHILKNAGLNVGLAGNIGKSLAWQVAENHFDYFVLELSSFQLDGMTDFKADIAVLLNITPDHLDRYDYKFQNYADSKFRITQNQTESDSFIYWNGDPVILSELEKRKNSIHAALYPFAANRAENTKAFIENNELTVKILNTMFTMPLDEMSLQGLHNSYNSMAAALAAAVLQVKKETIRESLRDFSGAEHRLEYVATVRNIRFVNDSKATNVNSCWYALESMKTPVILILGGIDKGNDYAEIADLIHEKVRALVFLGADNNSLHKFFDRSGKQIFDVHTMDDAVRTAYGFAREGDTVLLSPCCSSFDLFKSYEDRGRQFKACVRNL